MWRAETQGTTMGGDAADMSRDAAERRDHNRINGIATGLLDAGLQRRIAAVAIAGGRHGEWQKLGVSTKKSNKKVKANLTALLVDPLKL